MIKRIGLGVMLLLAGSLTVVVTVNDPVPL